MSSELDACATGSLEGADAPELNEDLIAATPTPLARVTLELQEQASRILANWALRVSTFPVFRATPDINLAQLQDGMPELLDAVLAAIASQEPALDPDAQYRIAELASAHGRKRATDGFSIGVLISELSELRAELWAAILRITEDDLALAGTPLLLQERLSGTFDPLIVDAAEAWVEEQRV
jgi:hypothetical protein